MDHGRKKANVQKMDSCFCVFRFLAAIPLSLIPITGRDLPSQASSVRQTGGHIVHKYFTVNYLEQKRCSVQSKSVKLGQTGLGQSNEGGLGLRLGLGLRTEIRQVQSLSKSVTAILKPFPIYCVQCVT
jgi:hypothetical protein